MGRCEVCGNEYDMTLQVTRGGETRVFDSFECAIHALAPTCDHCGGRIIGHEIEAGDAMYCCAHRAEAAGSGVGRFPLRNGQLKRPNRRGQCKPLRQSCLA